MDLSLSFNFVFWEFEPGWLHSNLYPTNVDLCVKDEAPKEPQKSAFALFLNDIRAIEANRAVADI